MALPDYCETFALDGPLRVHVISHVGCIPPALIVVLKEGTLLMAKSRYNLTCVQAPLRVHALQAVGGQSALTFNDP